MSVNFTKMHGTGNDFIMVDQFHNESFDLSRDQVYNMCNRRFGIGADGLIILRQHPDLDFEMIYFNSDGNLSSMCGNGGRCVVKMAYDHKYISEETTFWAPDGLHTAQVKNEIISLGMSDVIDHAYANGVYVLNTGSPHYIEFVDDVSKINVKEAGAKIRYSEEYKEEGVNVNFVELLSKNKMKIRTYERGVEDETFSCGTGVTAASIASFLKNDQQGQTWSIETKGGNLQVTFDIESNGFKNIKLIGPATKVYDGEIEL